MRGTHKGQNGRVLVVAGSEQYVGAAVLCGMAAFRSGVDLVYFAAPEKVAYVINQYKPDFITLKLKGAFLKKEHLKAIKPLVEKCDVVVIGPGLGDKPATKALVKEICKTKKPKVIDADALKAIDYKKVCNAVVTPHAKEFEILFKAKATKQNVKKFARKDFVVLLKGVVDVISDGKKTKENKTGNSALTSGGTGDVLAGLVAGFLAQKMSLYEAAYKATWVNGHSGDILFKSLGYGCIASDLLDVTPRSIADFEKRG